MRHLNWSDVNLSGENITVVKKYVEAALDSVKGTVRKVNRGS
jgi:hypothetical protein